jgi:hypothetical protein
MLIWLCRLLCVLLLAATGLAAAKGAASTQALTACSDKFFESQTAYDAQDLDAYLRLSAQAEKVCAALDEPASKASYAERRGDLLMQVRHDYAGAKTEYETCIARYYRSPFCHMGLVNALQGVNDEAGARAANDRAIRVIASLIAQHDLQAIGLKDRFPALVKAATQEREFLVKLKHDAEHRFDPTALDLPHAAPKKD